jgi:hypothetical protein
MSRLIIDDIKGVAAQGVTPKELREARVFLVLKQKASNYTTKTITAYGWVVEAKNKIGDTVVIPISTLFSGTLVDFRYFKELCPKGSIWEWKEGFVGPDKSVSTRAAFLNLVEARMTADNIWGYYDVLTPITPVPNRKWGFDWASLIGRKGPPIIPILRTSDVRIVERGYDQTLVSLAALKELPYIKDTELFLNEMRNMITKTRPEGVFFLSIVLNSFVAPWQKSQQTSQFASILTSYYWPIMSPGTPEERLEIWRGLKEPKRLIKNKIPQLEEQPKRNLVRKKIRKNSKARRRSQLHAERIEQAMESGDSEYEDVPESSGIQSDKSSKQGVYTLLPVEELIEPSSDEGGSVKEKDLEVLEPDPLSQEIPHNEGEVDDLSRVHCYDPACEICGGKPMPLSLKDWLKTKASIISSLPSSVLKMIEESYKSLEKGKDVLKQYFLDVPKIIKKKREEKGLLRKVVSNFGRYWNENISVLPDVSLGEQLTEIGSFTDSVLATGIALVWLVSVVPASNAVKQYRRVVSKTKKQKVQDSLLKRTARTCGAILCAPVFFILAEVQSFVWFSASIVVTLKNGVILGWLGKEPKE